MCPNVSAVHDFLMAHLMHLLTFHPIYRGLTSSVAHLQSLSPAVIYFPLCSYELGKIREPWRKTTLEPSFTCGYGCFVFKHDICGDQSEVPDCMFEFPNFLSLKCFASLRCPLVLASSEDATVGVHHREVA